MVLGFSLLIHENLLFFELQLQNIKEFHPSSIIVVNFKKDFYTKRKHNIEILRTKYLFFVNDREYSLYWSSPFIFNAIIDNLVILLHYEVDYLVQFSSNELLLKPLDDVITSRRTEKPVVFESSGKVALSTREKFGIEEDISFLKFLGNGNELICGYDFGRIYSLSAFQLMRDVIVFNDLVIFQKFIKYSRSEVVIPTILESLFVRGELVLQRECDFLIWFNKDCQI